MDQNKLMQQAMAMQNQLQQLEKQLEETLYTGESGGGVSIVINGKNEVQEVKIDEDLLDPENKQVLQDMIMLAMNHAVKEAEDDRESRLSGVTAGLNIPGMM